MNKEKDEQTKRQLHKLAEKCIDNQTNKWTDKHRGKRNKFFNITQKDKNICCETSLLR